MSAECYDEQLSDKCLTLLLGTWYESGAEPSGFAALLPALTPPSPSRWNRKENGTPCIVTKPCLDTMTRFGCPHYSLSHQLLYFLVGRMVRSCSW